MSDRDLKKLSRRQALGLFGAAGAALSAGACSGGTPTSPSATTTATTTTTTTGTTTTPPSTTTCAVTPSETAGPFPSIALPTRSDVREDRTGLLLLTLAIAVANTNAGCAPVTNASVEIWHCDARGDYSEYGTQTSATWLRGLQPVDATGKATFITVYPGWYQGRATHIHVEVFVGGRTVKTTRIAFPEDVNNAVYATGVYAARGQNPQKNATDMVFSDGVTSELATMSGSPTSGYNATFTVGVAI